MGAISFRILSETCTSAAANDIVLPVPRIGILWSLVIKQTSGTLAGYTAKVLLNDVSADNEVFYETVVPTITVAALASTHSYQATAGKPYIAVNELDTISQRVGNLYLRITPAGTGDKAFTVSVVAQGAGH